MKAIILAAGGGSRLAPIGLTRPKVLIPILNKPLLQHHLDIVSPLVNEVFIVVGPNNFGEQIEDFIQKHRGKNQVRTVIQEQPLGTANAYQAAVNIISGEHRLLCLNGDDLYSPHDIQQLLQHEYSVLGQFVNDPEKWGILNADEGGNLIQLVEKPANYIGSLAYTGAAVLSTEIFKLYHLVNPSSRGEYEFTETVTAFAQRHPVKTITVNHYWLPIGYPWHILNAHQQLTDKPVYGENVQIGKNVSITGSSVIGHNVVIGDNTVVTSSTIMDNTQIGINNHLEYSVIGQHALLESNITVQSLDQANTTVHSVVNDRSIDTHRQSFGTVIGDGAHIKSNITIAAGSKIWPKITVTQSPVTRDQQA